MRPLFVESGTPRCAVNAVRDAFEPTRPDVPRMASALARSSRGFDRDALDVTRWTLRGLIGWSLTDRVFDAAHLS